jgi:hypothetical protein
VRFSLNLTQIETTRLKLMRLPLDPAPIKATQAEACATGGIMSTVSSHVIGQYVQIAGAVAFITGAILSLHHYAIGICFVGGVAAFCVGKKMRAA